MSSASNLQGISGRRGMRAIILVLVMMFSLSGFAQTKSNDAPVKKSKTGICHIPGSHYYKQTKTFTSFTTLSDCLKSGGRLPQR
jgi:ABC-type microcin C transport system permease subunit YejE